MNFPNLFLTATAPLLVAVPLVSLALLSGCADQNAAAGTPPVSTAAVPGPPGPPNPSATDPNPRGYGPTSVGGAGSAEIGAPGLGVGAGAVR